MARMVLCKKLGRELPALTFQPFDDELGERIYNEISAEAWSMWLEHSKMLINEYRLDLVTPSEDDRAFLEFINNNLFGQPAAKEMLLRIHRAAKNPFRDRTRPIYKALMPGDSHTGKTETACVLADYYHGNPEAFIRINCANYKNKGDISRLLGTGPGWVGYQKPPTDEELAANKDKFDASALLSARAGRQPVRQRGGARLRRGGRRRHLQHTGGIYREQPTAGRPVHWGPEFRT